MPMSHRLKLLNKAGRIQEPQRRRSGNEMITEAG